MKKIVLDESKCLKHGLTLQETLILAAVCMPNFKLTFKNLISRGILNADGSAPSPQWGKVIGTMLGPEEEHLQQLARQLMQCFPEGKKPGTVFYFRCNTREVAAKLKKFFEVYSEYPDEQIIRATKKFVASFRGEYRLMPLLKYFISKNKKVMDENGENHIVETSELASVLENMSADEDIPEIADSDDWLVNSRN